MIAATNGKELFPLDQGKPTVKTGLKFTRTKTAAPLIAQVFDLAEQNNIKQLWALPGSQLHKQLTKLATVPGTDSGWTIKPDEPERLRKANIFTAWHPGQKAIQLVCPGRAYDDWKLDAVADAELWSEVVKLFIEYLRVSPSVPIRTMKKLAEQTLKSKQHWLTGPENPQLFTGHCDQPDLSYKQPVQDQRRRKWLHAYDKRNAYLSAFSVTLGVGESIEVNKPCEFSQRPGLWQCEVIKPRARSQWDIITGSAESFSGWFYTPLVQYFQQREYVIKIKRAVLYSFGHRVLEPTYNILRVALAQIPQNDRYSLKARAVAVKCLKSCYTQFIGWLAGAEHSQRGGPFYRPDWRQTIIAEAQARMARNIDKAIAAGVDQPVGVDVDSVLFYSDEPDPARAVPAPFTGSSVYRLKYSVPGPVAAELLSAPGSIQKINMQLKLESESK